MFSINFLGQCSHLVAFDQNPRHLLEQILKVPAAQSLDDLHQRSSRYVADLLETVPQQNANFDQDPGLKKVFKKSLFKCSYQITLQVKKKKSTTKLRTRGGGPP